MTSRFRKVYSLLLIAVLLPTGTALGEILCFCNFSNYTLNQTDSAAPPAISLDRIEITTAAGGEARSLFHNIKQNVSQFTASFTYQVSGGSTSFNAHPSLAFVLHNSANGAMAIGSSGPAFAYDGIGNSAAVSLQLNGSGATSSSASGLYTNGVVGGGSPDTSPVNLLLNNPVNVTLAYDGVSLRESLSDTITGATFERLYLIDIPQVIGSSTAYVGFTAATRNPTTHRQFLSNFRFSNVPEPSAVVLLARGGGCLRRMASQPTAVKHGAGGRNRTDTPFRVQHFKCCASTSFATPALG